MHCCDDRLGQPQHAADGCAQAGSASDFLDVLERLCPILERQPGLKIVTNAGGMNPAACAAKARAILAKGGLANKVVATVTGDDLLPRLDQLLAEGHQLTNMDTGQELAALADRRQAGLGSLTLAKHRELFATTCRTERR